MSTPATLDLIEEHSAIMLLLNIMEKVASKLEAGGNVPLEDLEETVDFIKVFADQCHHGKEEAHLFPAMLRDEKNARLINELLGEHALARDYVAGLSQALLKLQPANAEAYHFAKNARGYLSLLSAHINKENETLFPIADKMFSAEEQNGLAEKYEAVEREVIGPGRHEELHAWLDQMRQRYVG